MPGPLEIKIGVWLLNGIFFLWIAATIVLIVFLVKRGWSAMPRWHRNYVFCAVIIILWNEIMGHFAMSVAEENHTFYLVAAILWVITTVVTWWGIAVGVSQVRTLLRLAIRPRPA